MIQICCRVKDCEFPLTDAEHVDDGVHILQQHYRMIHPTKAFHVLDQANRLELYNQTLDELMVAYFGDSWSAPDRIPEVVDYCRRYITPDIKHEKFCKSTFEEATSCIEANPVNAAQERQQAQQAQQFIPNDVGPFDAAQDLPPIWNPNVVPAPRRFRNR